MQGDLRIAHCGGLHVEALNSLVKALNLVAKILHRKIQWDTETLGCSPSLSSIPALKQRLLSDALTEIRTWVDKVSLLKICMYISAFETFIYLIKKDMNLVCLCSRRIMANF